MLNQSRKDEQTRRPHPSSDVPLLRPPARAHRSRALPALFAVALLAACKEPTLPRTIAISEAAAAHTTAIATGDRLEITLAENITTGYSWKLDDATCGGALHLDSDQPAPPPANSPPGAGGHRTWILTGLHEARCELRFQSARPWEKTATGKSLVFPVVIQKGP